MSARLFSDEQEKFILDNYEKLSNKQIAAALGEHFSRSQVAAWLTHRGFLRHKYENGYKERVFSKEATEFVKDHYLSMTYRDIAAELGVTERQVTGKVASLKLPTKKRIHNSEFFENIDNPLKAYFIGFIFADGWVVCKEQKRTYEFGMELQSRDSYVLEKLNEVLGGQDIIRHKAPREKVILGSQVAHGGPTDVLRVDSKQLVNNLIKNGIVPNKTLCNTFPAVDDSLFFDFLRGYIDGDGCFYKNKGHVYMHITSATEDVLRYIQDKLQRRGIKTQIYCGNSRKYRLMCTNFDSMKKLVNSLYYDDGLFFLRRKYDCIKHLIGLAA